MNIMNQCNKIKIYYNKFNKFRFKKKNQIQINKIMNTKKIITILNNLTNNKK